MKQRRCSMKSPENDARGFTLIEILIALVVFTIGILAVMTLTLASMNGFTRARRENVEINRAALNLESLKYTAYDDATYLPDNNDTAGVVMGDDGAAISYRSQDDAMVQGTKLISLRNARARVGDSIDGNFTVYYIKPEITQPE